MPANNSSYALRKAEAEDEALLADVVAQALNLDPVDHNATRYSASSWADPSIVGISLQSGVVAIDSISGECVGAAWYRLRPVPTPGFAYVNSETPELSVFVLPDRRGIGLGTRLVRAVCMAAEREHDLRRLCVSVDAGGPGARLLKRLGGRLADPGERESREGGSENVTFLLPLPLPPNYLSLITTPGYAPGIVALAQSLSLCGSAATLTALCTNSETLAAVRREALSPSSSSSSSSSPPPSLNLCLELLPVSLPIAPLAPDSATHGAYGALLSVDAPRRALWGPAFLAEHSRGFTLLDADLLAVQNPDGLIKGARERAEAGGGGTIMATAAFRVKKGRFGVPEDLLYGFNSGVLVIGAPRPEDGEALDALVVQDGEAEGVTEELLLNRIFKGRWQELPHGLNVPKRVLAHAPQVWNGLLERRELAFVHYMGAKPWQSAASERAACDWEAENPVYASLEGLWRGVRGGEVKLLEDGTLLGLLPKAGAGP